MPAKFNGETVNAVTAILQQFPQGATRGQIRKSLTDPPDDATFAGWMKAMISTKTVRSDGPENDPLYFAIVAEGTEPEPETVQAVSPTATNLDPDFAGMFDLGSVMFVTCALTREGTREALQRQAAEYKKAGPAMKAYVEYALDRLDKFTVTEAETTYGFLPQQYAKWEQNYRHGRPISQPPKSVAEVEPAPRTNAARVSASPASATTPPPAPVNSSTREAFPPEATVTDEVPPTPVSSPAPTPALDPFTAEGMLQALQHGRSHAYQKKAFDTIRSLLTPLRLGICLSIAVGLRLTAHALMPFGYYAGFVIFPLAGLPWVFFRWYDETEQTMLGWGEAVSILLAGGVVSLIVASGVFSILNMLHMLVS